MTTRSGLNYRSHTGIMSETGHSQTSGLETEGPGDIQKVLQMLLDDCRKREEEIAAERRQREQEAVAKRERQERETERRLQEMQKHVDALLKVVERSHEGTSGTKREVQGAGDEKEVRLTKLSEAGDVEAYFTTFERMMTAFEVQKERWVFKLAPYLTGKAQQAYAAMAAEDAGEYECLKAAILKRYNINEETYRVRFWAVARKPEEGYAELATRVMDMDNEGTEMPAAEVVGKLEEKAQAEWSLVLRHYGLGQHSKSKTQCGRRFWATDCCVAGEGGRSVMNQRNLIVCGCMT